MCGLVLLAAACLLPGCTAAQKPLGEGQDSFASPFTAKPLLRLASLERGKVDIVVSLDEPRRSNRPILTPNDQLAKTRALWHAVKGAAIGEAVEWSNGETGSHGVVEIMRDVRIPESDRICREYHEAFVVEGRKQSDAGQFCQLRNGSWSKIEG